MAEDLEIGGHDFLGVGGERSDNEEIGGKGMMMIM